MDAVLLLKWIHILSATVLFGTGLGTALQLVLSHRTQDVRAIAAATRNVVTADWLCTLPSGIIQPLSGVALVMFSGHDPLAGWLLAAYALYVIAGICWIIVVILQLRMARVATDAANAGKRFLPDQYHRDYQLWFALGWPAFLSLIAVFGLMVFKPDF
jgi:uncharacterized membrane protein